MRGMQFRDYIFPHNPASIHVSWEDVAALHLCPGRGEVAQALGRRARTVRCEGCFWGGSFGEAAAQLEAFQRAADRGGTGSLFLPGLAPFLAHLLSFSWQGGDDGRILPYTMVFVEAEAAP